MEQQTNKRDKPLLVIGNKNYSSWSLRAWLMLRHAGIDFEEMRIPLATPGCDLKLLYFSPAGKVPVYRKGDLAVWDSLAIAEYLYEQYPALWPADPVARAHARSISAEMHAGFSALRTAMPMNIRARDRKVERTPGVEADIVRIFNIWRDLRTQYLAQGSWLFGAYSIADAMFAPVVFRFRTYGVREAGLIEEYIETVLHDPLIQDWIQSSQREQEVIVAYEAGIHHGWHIADT
jgi:glutathione S-transferase